MLTLNAVWIIATRKEVLSPKQIERSAGVKDQAGNHWYIATHKGPRYVPEGWHDVNVYLHLLRAEPVIKFLTRAFKAQERAKYAFPDGVVHHAQVQMGTSVLEMGEAHGAVQPMSEHALFICAGCGSSLPSALAAGASSLQEPADQPWGDHMATVKDAFGNTWNIATHIGVTPA